MKEAAGIEATDREGGSVRVSDEELAQTSSAGSAPARKPAVHAKATIALDEYAETGREPETQAFESESPEEGLDADEVDADQPVEAEFGGCRRGT